MALKQTRRAVSLNRDVYTAATEAAKERGVTLSQLVTDALRAYADGVPETHHTPVEAVRRAVRARARQRRVLAGSEVLRRMRRIA